MVLATPCQSQTARAKLDTSDVDLFYQVFDAADGKPSAEQIQTLYIDRGSNGLRTFLKARRTSAQRIADSIATRPRLYEEARTCAKALPRVRTRVDAALAKLVVLYPQAHLPTVTVAVGRGRPVAIGSPVTGVQVGLEALCATTFIAPDVQDRFVGVLVHEYIHAQQAAALTEKEHPTVLETALLEGSAEFVTELLTGQPAYRYFGPLTKGREAEIEAAFFRQRASTDLSAWFFNSTAEEPADLGYWVGYRIAKSHYRNTSDKQRALREIITASDAEAFLAASGWIGRASKSW